MGTKGRVRAAMWQEAKDWHDAGRIRATEVRGSDYIAPTDASRVGSNRVVPRILQGKTVSLIGPLDFPHSWTSPADVAALMLAAAANPEAWGKAWHVPSNLPRTQREVIQDLADAAGVPRVAVKQVPELAVRMLGMINPAIRELGETNHQWDRPFVIDDAQTRTTFNLTTTPWPQVLEGVIAHYR
jgi:nucleoside-diphosphate-sugar epimerase